MRAKYKIGNLVEIQRTANDAPTFGVVGGVITYKDGYQYALEGEEISDAVREDQITRAFRPVTTRTAKARIVRGKKSKSEGVAAH
jgi:hypothetical protein